MAVLEIEVLGAELLADGPSPREVRRLCELALATAHVSGAHLAVEFVDAERIARLNGAYRGKPQPTDVLSFPIDGIEDLPVSLGETLDETTVRLGIEDLPVSLGETPGETTVRWQNSESVASPGTPAQEPPAAGRLASVPRELGDVVICPEYTSDVRAAVVHGVLHLLGMDHETDAGEMLALQARLLGPEDA